LLFSFTFQCFVVETFFLRVERVVKGGAVKGKVIIKAKAISVRVALLPLMLPWLQL